MDWIEKKLKGLIRVYRVCEVDGHYLDLTLCFCITDFDAENARAAFECLMPGAEIKFNQL